VLSNYTYYQVERNKWLNNNNNETLENAELSYGRLRRAVKDENYLTQGRLKKGNVRKN